MSELNEKEIIDVWYRNVGFSPSRVSEHWREIQEWLNRKPKTTLYMTPEDRTALDEEITLAVATMRTRLARLRQTETPEQQRARKERQKQLDRRNEILSKRETEAA